MTDISPYLRDDLDDAGLDLADVRPILDEIERRVCRLLDEVHVSLSR